MNKDVGVDISGYTAEGLFCGKNLSFDEVTEMTPQELKNSILEVLMLAVDIDIEEKTNKRD